MTLHINLKRALAYFFLAWLAMDILGTVSYLLLSLLMTGALPTMAATGAANIAADPVWKVSNVVLPIINLPVWLLCAWLYFKKPRTTTPSREAWQLGLFWLAIVLPLDFLHYVAIPTPLTIGAKAFYIDQFPWIYIVYAIVLAGPQLMVRYSRRGQL
jgi:hypothetical protein